VNCATVISAVLGQVREDSWWDKFPGLWDLVILLTALGLVALMVWFVTGAKTSRGFIIRVDETDVHFSGQFPPQAQNMVINFLRNDVALPGSYEIRGQWEGQLLVVVVKGEHARAVEQRIRNFLKLNLKPPAMG
jgi:hypothetical protein